MEQRIQKSEITLSSLNSDWMNMLRGREHLIKVKNVGQLVKSDNIALLQIILSIGWIRCTLLSKFHKLTICTQNR